MSAEFNPSGAPGDEQPARRRRRRRRRRGSATAGEGGEATAAASPAPPSATTTPSSARPSRAARNAERRPREDAQPRTSSVPLADRPIASKWVWLALGFWAGFFVVTLPEGVARGVALLVAVGTAVLLAATYRRWVRAQLDEARARRAGSPRR